MIRAIRNNFILILFLCNPVYSVKEFSEMPKQFIKIEYLVKEKNLYSNTKDVTFQTKAFLKKKNDSISFVNCSKDYTTSDNCLYGVAFKYCLKEKIIETSYKIDSLSYVNKRYSLNPNDTLYSFSELHDIRALDGDFTLFEGNEILNIQKQKYDCYVFKICKFKSFKQKSVTRLYLSKNDLLPLKIKIEIFTINEKRLGVSYDATAAKINHN